MISAGGRDMPSINADLTPLTITNDGPDDASSERRSPIEALRKTQEWLLVALAAGRMGTWRYDLKTGEQVWNTRQYELLGIDPSQPPTRDLFLSIVHPDDLQKVAFDPADPPPASGCVDAQFRVVKPDGSIRWIEARGLFAFDAAGKASELIGVDFDITEQKQAEAQQQFLLGELNHRIKNMLAIVQAIVGQTVRGSENRETAIRDVGARLVTLSNTHDLLTTSNGRGASLYDVVSAELGPYGEQRIRCHGPDVTLNPRAAMAFGIVFHELATNATKYGALSAHDGCVAVLWRVAGDADDRLDLQWREAGGPIVPSPRRQGFGSRLIEASVTDKLGGTISVDYAPSGVVCAMSIPLATAASHSDDDKRRRCDRSRRH